ncbi:hypothetical protein BU15DRAFT_53607, partial [Melanogaster broomeanus]
CPPAIRECKALFDKHITGNREPAFSSARAVFHARHQQAGVLFSRHSTHVSNSLIMFYPAGSRTPVPRCIKYIFEDNECVQFTVQRHLPASPNVVDPFPHYPYFPARLYSKDLDPNHELVDPVKVLSHCARWHFSAQYVAVLVLTKVGSFSTPSNMFLMPILSGLDTVSLAVSLGAILSCAM